MKKAILLKLLITLTPLSLSHNIYASTADNGVEDRIETPAKIRLGKTPRVILKKLESPAPSGSNHTQVVERCWNALFTYKDDEKKDNRPEYDYAYLVMAELLLDENTYPIKKDTEDKQQDFLGRLIKTLRVKVLKGNESKGNSIEKRSCICLAGLYAKYGHDFSRDDQHKHTYYTKSDRFYQKAINLGATKTPYFPWADLYLTYGYVPEELTPEQAREKGADLNVMGFEQTSRNYSGKKKSHSVTVTNKDTMEELSKITDVRRARKDRKVAIIQDPIEIIDEVPTQDEHPRDQNPDHPYQDEQPMEAEQIDLPRPMEDIEEEHPINHEPASSAHPNAEDFYDNCPTDTVLKKMYPTVQTLAERTHYDETVVRKVLYLKQKKKLNQTQIGDIVGGGAKRHISHILLANGIRTYKPRTKIDPIQVVTLYDNLSQEQKKNPVGIIMERLDINKDTAVRKILVEQREYAPRKVGPAHITKESTQKRKAKEAHKKERQKKKQRTETKFTQ